MSLNREFTITSEQTLKAAFSFADSNWEPMQEQGTPLFLIFTNAAEKRRAQQNKYYFGVIIRSISEQAWVQGKQWSAEAWHEYFASYYGIQKDVTLPDGSVLIKRLSTTEMKVREFSEYVERVTAYGATELGIRFPAMEQF